MKGLQVIVAKHQEGLNCDILEILQLLTRSAHLSMLLQLGYWTNLIIDVCLAKRINVFVITPTCVFVPVNRRTVILWIDPLITALVNQPPKTPCPWHCRCLGICNIFSCLALWPFKAVISISGVYPSTCESLVTVNLQEGSCNVCVVVSATCLMVPSGVLISPSEFLVRWNKARLSLYMIFEDAGANFLPKICFVCRAGNAMSPIGHHIPLSAVVR